ncbi:PTS transporter subunit EIIC [Lactiplantibacillus pingfangensis]|uniref:PTS transporter subunit EIIC n=1 Tax=Lactiplantibacillus pingfangensis TaxID=2559915 RepID=UPI0010F93A18|nr:PTS transporter subunit EIIC [Lactiplantibacillus pingfangensis]
MKKYAELSSNVLELIGGAQNVSFLTHCVTRVRINVKDKSLVQDKKVEKLDKVIGTQWSGEQFQIIIGQGVETAYEEILAETGLHGNDALNDADDTEKKSGIINQIFDVLSGTFVMFIPVLIAAGMISALLSLLTTFGLVSAKDPTYIVFSAVQSGIFFFLPIFAGYAAGTKMKMNPFVGMALGAILCYSTINGAKGLAIFGIKLMSITYSSTVFPIILGVWFMAYVERGLKRVIPDMLKTIVVPAVTLLCGLIATLLILGPIGAIAGIYLGKFITMLNTYASWFAPALIALIYPVMVFTGMHYALIPMVVAALANPGYDTLLMVAGFISNMSEAGAAMSSAALAKNASKRAELLTIGVTALVGVTEPALFGITLRNKRTLVSVGVGGALGALFAGLFSCKAYGFVSGLPSLPLFLGKTGFVNLVVIIIAILISFSVTAILNYLLNKRGTTNDAIS